MKKYFLLIAAAATVLAVSCNKARELAPVASSQEEIDDSTPMPVRFGSSLNTQLETKAAVTQWANTMDLYIYGFEKNDQGKFIVETVGNEPAAFINNVKAQAPSADGIHPNTASIDVYNPDVHVAANPTAEPPVAEYNEPFYYSDGKVYDFFGYYLGEAYSANNVDAVVAADAAAYNTAKGTNVTEAMFNEEGFIKTITPAILASVPAIDATSNVVSTVSIPVTIDGTNDIMLAKTDHEFDVNPNKYVPESKFYSSYAARRGVNPNLKFEHQLSRFIFKTRKGGNIDYDKITIKGIAMKSKAEGVLTIYGDAESANHLLPDANAQEILLPLRNADGSLLGSTAVHPNNSQTEFAQVGESIMVFAGQQNYSFVLSLAQEGVTAGIKDQLLAIDLSQIENVDENYVALPGYQYVVNLVIYGVEKVEITVSLTPWEDGGEVTIDTDKDIEDERAATQIVDVNQDFEIAYNAEDVAVTGKVQYQNGETWTDLANQPALTITSSNPAAATIVNGKVHPVAIGQSTITVSYAGGLNYKAAEDVTFTVSVVQAANPLAVMDGITEQNPLSILFNSPGPVSLEPAQVVLVDPGIGDLHISATKDSVEVTNPSFSFDQSGNLVVTKVNSELPQSGLYVLTLTADGDATTAAGHATLYVQITLP